VTKCLDPARDDPGVRLRTARLRRGMTQTALAGLARMSPAFVSMVETGQRSLRSADHILALADALRVSPFYLAVEDFPPGLTGKIGRWAERRDARNLDYAHRVGLLFCAIHPQDQVVDAWVGKLHVRHSDAERDDARISELCLQARRRLELRFNTHG